MDSSQLYQMLHDNIYNDQFNRNNQYSMTLYRPDSIVSQSDLNETQSFLHDQFRLFGNYLFQNGTIISGLNLNIGSPQHKNKANPNLAQDQKNLLNQEDISAVNSTINRGGYIANGSVNVAPDSATSDAYPGVELYVNNIPHNNNIITVSFSIQQQTGNLRNISFDYPNSVQVQSASLDGSIVSANSPISNLNDGQSHTVVYTFKITDNSTVLPLYLSANNGFDVTQTNNTVRFQLGSLMVNTGNTPSSWRPSYEDSDVPSNERDVPVNVSSGYVYMDGYIRYFSGTTQPIMISGSGRETLGLTIDYEPYEQYDTTKGAVSQGERMADRLGYVLHLKYNDNTAVNVFTLQDGKIPNGNASTGNAHLDALLAERTYDQSGSFRVSGFDFHTENDPRNSNGGLVSINQGIAYVMGYGVYKTSPTNIPFEIPTQTESALDEVVDRDISRTGIADTVNIGDTNTSEWISDPLDHQPLKKDTLSVDGTVQVGGSDFLHPEHNNGGDLGTVVNGQFQFNNGMLFPTGDEDISVLPKVFSADESSKAGGVIGDFTLYVIPGGQDTPAAAVTYDAESGDTLITKSVEYGTDITKLGKQIASASLTDKNDKPYSVQGQSALCVPNGIVPIPDAQTGDWSIRYLFDSQTMQEVFGNTSGATLYIQGKANYHFRGMNDIDQDDGSAKPDYIIEGTDNNTSGSTLKNKVSTGNDAILNARIAFNVPGKTTGVVPSNSDYGYLTASYQFYLARVAVITLDKNGTFNLIEGTPAPLGEAKPPEQQDQNTLRLGYVVELPDTYKSNCKYSAVTRIPFWGLDDLVTRVSNLEMSLQNVLMGVQSKNNIDPTTINDMLDDDFTTFATADVSYSINSVFNIAYDLSKGIISVDDIPSSVQEIYPQLNGGSDYNSDTTDNSYHIWNNILTGDTQSTKVPQEYQTASTTNIPLNAQNTNGSVNGLLSITPDTDDFVDCSKYGFKGNPNPQQLHNWFAYTDLMKPRANNFRNLENAYSFGSSYERQGLSQWSMKGSTGRNTASTANEYTHSRIIHFHTDWLPPKTSGYRIILNDQYNPSTDYNLQGNFTVDKTQRETSKGYPPMTYTNKQGQDVHVGLDADENGSLSGSFVLPDNLSTGAIKITLTNKYSGLGGNSSVSTIYNANGINNYNSDNVDSTTVSHAYESTDPSGQVVYPQLGQVIHVTKGSTISGVALDLHTSDTNNANGNSNVLVQLRDAQTVGEEQLPSARVLAQCTITNHQIQSAQQAQSMTDCMFDDPVYIPGDNSVAITVYTNYKQGTSSSFSGYSVGASVYSGNTSIMSNPDMNLYTSDGTKWTIDPNIDLAFELYRARFYPSATITFDPIDLSNYYQNITGNKLSNTDTISKFTLLANYVTPEDTNINWSIRIGLNQNGSNSTKEVAINSRRQVQRITDLVNETQDEHNPANITLLQLIAWFNQGNTSTQSLDETMNNMRRVSPMVDIGSIGLALSEANNTEGRNLTVDSSKANDQTYLKSLMTNSEGLYITRNLATKGYNTITTTFDSHEDDHCKVLPIFSTDEGSTWHLYSEPQNSSVQGYPTYDTVNNEFTRVTYKTEIPKLLETGDNSAIETNFKMGLVFLTDSPYHQPEARRLSNTLTLEDNADDNDHPSFSNDYDDTNNNNWSKNRMNGHNNPNSPHSTIRHNDQTTTNYFNGIGLTPNNE